MAQQGAIYSAIGEVIRERSKAGHLIQFEEILTELARQGLLKPEVADERFHFEASLKEAVENNEDLKEISSRDRGPYYYSAQNMSEAYARILIRKDESPLLLMAEIIRENSAIYPRPVPLDVFRESPFELTQEETLECLKKMSEQGEYQDISQTTTSIGTIFLYSNQHLDPGYASMLAEWFDVGQVNNP